jgi:hypothetical protein
MRRRLDLKRLSDQILVVLHQQFFDDTVEYISFKLIRENLKNQPANAVRLELDNLLRSNHAVRETEERRQQPNFLAGTTQVTTFHVPLDGYKISKSGIVYVEEFGDDYYSSLEKELGLDAHALELPKVDESSWAPIPLDRNDLQQEQAAEALDRIIEELRGDNGYAATNPEEKAFVQDKLSAVARRLKEDSQISWMYLQEFAFKPLGILIKRFGGAAIGIAAATAKDAFVSWLKSKGIAFLDNVVN